MLSAQLEAHDEARFARAVAHTEVFRIKLSYPQREASGDPGLIERACGVELPESFCEFMRRLDGGAIQGEGGVLAIWKTRENLALHHEDYRAFKSTPGARVVFFASDYGSREYFFDVDDYYGHGAYAVLLADQCSDNTDFIATTFYAAVDLIIEGPRPYWEATLSPRPRPAGSERA